MTKLIQSNLSFFSKLQKVLILLLVVLMLTGCGDQKPPIGFAPDVKIIQRAIALQVQQAQQSLSNQLTTSLPESEISKVTVNQLEPLYLGKLPTYRLQGTYRLTLKLSEQKVEKQDNPFDIYLQRQIEGKTWRLVKEEPENHQWLSYSLEQY